MSLISTDDRLKKIDERLARMEEQLQTLVRLKESLPTTNSDDELDDMVQSAKDILVRDGITDSRTLRFFGISCTD